MDSFEAQALLIQFEQAAEIARDAKMRYLKKKVTKAAGGYEYPSPYFKIWSESTQNMIRLARLLKSAGVAPKTLDEELDAVLA